MENFTLEQYLHDLEYLVNFDNGSFTPEGTRRVAEFFQQRFVDGGWQTELVEVSDGCVGPCLKVCNCDEDNYDVLLLGHMDTVFPAGEAAKRPYKLSADGIATGVGVSDMKGCILSAYYALAELTNEGSINGSRVCLLLNSDEELGSPYSRSYIEKTAQNAACVLVIEAARASGDMVKERSGIANYTLRAYGTAAHAGVAPQNGSSAINELANWIIELHKLSDYAVGTSVNVGLISGGSASNVVADYAEAEVDIRYKLPSELTRIRQAVEELGKKSFTAGGAHIEAEYRDNRPPMNASEATLALCREISAMGRQQGLEFDWVATGGGSDGNFTAAMGIPTVDGIGPLGAGGHSVKEWLDTKSVEPRLKLLKSVIAKLCKK